ncbi:Crp/Fnr family transcriptional regulator [Crocinitomix catalasitica]|uniref:Crp/Fnr family transcriptional regulator n=1 Tax=Crocinitomix catalasitica TaxID=184607 RepID=UPI00048987F8|nr:Crp/Fnr family transcriptional regulator [Crocinitomix catalasitica]
METRIIKFLSKYTVFSKHLEKAIRENTFFKVFEKGTVLLKEGDHSNECYFILNGCIRSYFYKDGEEITNEFYTEEQVVAPTNYGKGTPSTFYLECTEEVIASIGNPVLEKETFQKYPELESLSRVIAEAMIAKHQETFAEFKSSNPEERYMNMLKTRPDLINRVAHYQLASYLGVKPESLSRIRKRILKKNDLS